MKRIFFLVGLLLILFASCDNEVDINNEGEDISIIYGLLNQNDTRHYIKLTKSFLVDGSIYTGAADAANSEYDPADIEMVLIEYNNGNYMRTIPMDTILVSNKDTGIFYAPNQLIYATPENTILHESYTYQIQAKVKSLDRTIRASTSLIQDFNITKPNIGQRFVSFTGTLPASVEYRSAENGKLHQLTIRFFYTEKDANNNLTSHFVDWPMAVRKSDGTDGGEKMTEEYYGEVFYQNLAAHLEPPTNGEIRYPDSVQFIFGVGNEELAVYMDVNKPASGIITEKPAYTNVENGLGIFASRYQKIRTFEGITTLSIQKLMEEEPTSALGFENYPNP